jgi:hypothetical protein
MQLLCPVRGCICPAAHGLQRDVPAATKDPTRQGIDGADVIDGDANENAALVTCPPITPELIPDDSV